MKETVLAVPGTERIQIHCDPRNVASRRVPELVEYALIATRRGNKQTPEGEPRDTLVFETRASATSRRPGLPL